MEEIVKVEFFQQVSTKSMKYEFKRRKAYHNFSTICTNQHSIHSLMDFSTKVQKKIKIKPSSFLLFSKCLTN